MHTIVLSTGSNLGDRMKILNSALEDIEKSLGRIRNCSSFYESPSWGYESKNRFYNQCVEVLTERKPDDCLNLVRKIEDRYGREREEREYHDRMLDIDILFYDQVISDTEFLKIPHPRLHERKFVLVPLAEIMPEWEHPVFHKTIRKLLSECPDSLEIYPVK